MSNFKTKWKVFWRIVGECFMRSLTPSVMFFVAGLVLLMLQSKNFGLSAQMAWAALCAVYSLFLHPYIRRGLHAFLSSGICIFFLGGYVGILLIDLALSFAAIAP